MYQEFFLKVIFSDYIFYQKKKNFLHISYLSFSEPMGINGAIFALLVQLSLAHCIASLYKASESGNYFGESASDHIQYLTCPHECESDLHLCDFHGMLIFSGHHCAHQAVLPPCLLGPRILSRSGGHFLHIYRGSLFLAKTIASTDMM